MAVALARVAGGSRSAATATRAMSSTESGALRLSPPTGSGKTPRCAANGMIHISRGATEAELEHTVNWHFTLDGLNAASDFDRDRSEAIGHGTKTTKSKGCT